MKRWFLLEVWLLGGLLSPVLSAAQEVEQMGSWYYQASLDPITDVNSSGAFTMDDDREWVLGIHCRGGRYSGAIIISTSLNGSLLRLKAIGETWRPRMTWRIDEAEPIIESWTPLEHGLRIRNDRADSFAEALMLAKKRVVMRFSHSAATYTVVMAADGAAEAIGALNRCN